MVPFDCGSNSGGGALVDGEPGAQRPPLLATIALRLRYLKRRLRYWRWRLAHPTAAYATYYAEATRRRLERGKHHPHLALSDDLRRGREPFDALVAWGLEPHHRCIDYGCGSLRVGQHLVRALLPGNYCGLDVTDRFYRAGLAHLGADLIREKQPRFAVITKATLEEEGARPPDFFLAVAVVKHIPPRELDEQLDAMLHLIGPNTRALITFSEAPHTMRIAGKGKSWAYSAAALTTTIQAKRPDLRLEVRPLTSDGHQAPGAFPKKAAVWIGSGRSGRQIGIPDEGG